MPHARPCSDEKHEAAIFFLWKGKYNFIPSACLTWQQQLWVASCGVQLFHISCLQHKDLSKFYYKTNWKPDQMAKKGKFNAQYLG